MNGWEWLLVAIGAWAFVTAVFWAICWFGAVEVPEWDREFREEIRHITLRPGIYDWERDGES